MTTGELPGVMSHDVYNVLVIIIARILLPLTEIFGIITNSVNLLVFWSMGLKDSVTISFFALTLADWCYLVASLVGWTCSLLGEFSFQQWINLKNLSYISVWYSLMFLAMSVFLTTYIAIQRCCCVALPLKFKGVFTNRLNTTLIAVMCVISAALHIPILSKMGLKKYFNAKTNTTKVAIWFADDWDSVLVVKDALVGLWLPISTQIITVICMGILISGLRASSRFRRLAAADTTTSTTTTATTTSTSSTNKEKDGEPTDDAKSGHKGNKKEIQVVKAVTVVTLMFIVSNTAPICQAVVRQTMAGFGLYKRFNNVFFVVVVSKHAFQHLNASLNMFVYLRFNSAYRTIFNEIFKSLKRA